jgi:RHS repeat-associated protein
VRYSAYGEPTAYPVADLDMDGQVTSADLTAWTDLKAGGSSASAYGLDLDFDDYYGPGEADEDLFWESYDANLGLSGKGRVSTLGVASRVGYAGYQWDQVARAYHVRYRVYLPETGRWTRRDPLGYVDGMSLYEYVGSMTIRFSDASGNGKNKKLKGPKTPGSSTDQHDRYGAHFSVQIICRGRMLENEGWQRLDQLKRYFAAIKKSGCCISYLALSMHHDGSSDISYSCSADMMPDASLASSIDLCNGALVDLRTCDGFNLVNELIKNNRGKHLRFNYTIGENAYDAVWGIDFTPLDSCGSNQTYELPGDPGSRQ